MLIQISAVNLVYCIVERGYQRDGDGIVLTMPLVKLSDVVSFMPSHVTGIILVIIAIVYRRHIVLGTLMDAVLGKHDLLII